jgi:hypothetical protein
MHGIIFTELKKFVVQSYGAATWNAVLDGAGASSRTYLPWEIYPDAEIAALVTEASIAARRPEGALIEEFGAFVAPDLLGLYGALVNPAWRTLDVLERTEETIHRVVRLKMAGADPPELRAERRSADEVRIVYGSARGLCALARGITRGLARHYGERVSIDDATCMQRGDPVCTLVVRREP